jgi:HEPN domain-containing protein
MKSDLRAQAFLTNARLIYDEAQESAVRGHYHRTLRKCQEAVELALKGCLLFLGLDYPRVHDVAPEIREVLLRMHLATDAELDQLTQASARLRAEREISFYGDEDGTPPQELFDASDAEQALSDCRLVLEFVEKSRAGPKPV